MASNKWQAKRRVRNIQRRKAKRLASTVGAAAQPINNHHADKATTETSPPDKPKTPQGPSQKPKIKTINQRERLRILEKTVVWMHEAFGREAGRIRDRLRRAEQQIALLCADRAEMKRTR